VTFSNYGSIHIQEWRTTSGWAAFDSGLADVPANCIAVNKHTRTLYAGTEIGVYYRDSSMNYWVFNSAGMPAVSVTNLELNYALGEIWASTYGRGLWLSSIPFPTSVQSLIPYAPDVIRVAPNPSYGKFLVSLDHIQDAIVDIDVIDMYGKIVWTQKQITNDGSGISIELGDLLTGNYVIEVYSKGVVAGKQKIVVAR
jgi:hypothetical protein